jgi:hypothetical protein
MPLGYLRGQAPHCRHQLDQIPPPACVVISGDPMPADAQTRDLLRITKAQHRTERRPDSQFPQVSMLMATKACPSECPSWANSHRLLVRIMYMTWVELWGFEPQTSCMPFLPIPSGCIALRRIPAGQAACIAWLGLAASDAA